MRPARFLTLAAAIVLLAACAGAWRIWALYTGPGPSVASVQLVVPRGSGAEMAALLAARGVIASPLAFALGTRIDGLAARLRAGEYLFPAGLSARAAAELLASGRTVQRRITIAEGLTVAQVATLLRNAEGMDGDVAPLPPEGSLLPETYFYSWGDPRMRTVERAQRAMRETLAELWEKRVPDLPLAEPQQAVVLASIVEKETAHPDERTRVAAVFVNRLRARMRLQADPTVAYGIDPSGPLGRPLSRADLETRHAWNTYAIDGLPPTPIANPGRASLEAALNPAKTDELYFVADGEGRHVFARTLAEHNRNVARLRERERARGTPN